MHRNYVVYSLGYNQKKMVDFLTLGMYTKFEKKNLS